MNASQQRGAARRSAHRPKVLVYTRNIAIDLTRSARRGALDLLGLARIIQSRGFAKIKGAAHAEMADARNLVSASAETLFASLPILMNMNR